MASSIVSTADYIDLLLLGTTGVGKSSTGNAILGRKDFETSDSSDSITRFAQVSWARREGRIVKVVDCPGVVDTRMTRAQAKEAWRECISEGMTLCPKGFHALILIMRYGDRYTQEQQYTIDFLKLNFGESFVKRFCILVFTHGDLFDMNYGNQDMTFEHWCDNQTRELQQLMVEFNHRVVLFRNNDETQWIPQLKKLFEIVDGLENRGERYTNEIFNRIAREREKLIEKENAQMLRLEIQARIDLLSDGLNELQGLNVTNNSALDSYFAQVLLTLKEDARQLRDEISRRDKGTGVLTSLSTVVVRMQTNIDHYEEVVRERRSEREIENARRDMLVQNREILEDLHEEQRRRNTSWGSMLTSVAKVVLAFLVSPIAGAVVAGYELSRIWNP